MTHRSTRGILLCIMGVLAGFVLACFGGSSSEDGCASDMDCKGDRICVEGACEAPAEPAAKPAAKPTAKSASGSHSRATKCTDPCLFLMEHSFRDVQNNLCEWCPNTSDYCELDWPSSDVPDCGSFDYLRNCIYAGHGYSFSKEKWQHEFAQTTWYRADPNYDSSNLSKAASANVRDLKRRAKEQDGCLNYD